MSDSRNDLEIGVGFGGGVSSEFAMVDEHRFHSDLLTSCKEMRPFIVREEPIAEVSLELWRTNITEHGDLGSLVAFVCMRRIAATRAPEVNKLMVQLIELREKSCLCFYDM
mmetsp:Transcript_6964/g.9061  ORF Transcript_6964/g.9061 Transcript_6964/m.9061 type:complete len:111 (-) Transcript_6964:23-355(-)